MQQMSTAAIWRDAFQKEEAKKQTSRNKITFHHWTNVAIGDQEAEAQDLLQGSLHKAG